MNLRKLKAIVFDLDGVLTDTSKVHMQAWMKAISEYEKSINLPIASEFSDFDYERLLSGRSRISGLYKVSVDRGWPDKSLSLIDEIANNKNKYFLREINKRTADQLLFADAVRFLNRIAGKNIKFGLCSSSKNARLLLNAANLADFFDDIVDGNDEGEFGIRSKPHPDPFDLSLSRLGVSGDDSMIVEDSEAGVRAALNSFASVVVFLNRNEMSVSENPKIFSELRRSEKEVFIIKNFDELGNVN